MPRNRRRKSIRLSHQMQDIPAKANRVLNFILIAFILIIIRIWHLTVIQHDKRVEESRRPQRRYVVEAPKRGTIYDRFDIPMAINRIQYQAAIQYSPLKQIPTIHWEADIDGKRIKHFKRKEYIRRLSVLLANELSIDPDRVEDLIHSKCALYNHLPFVIKEDITEKEYYRLKMLEKDWPGIVAEKLPRRYYPLGRVGGDIIGYMGAINRKEYESLIHEMASLREYLQEREAGENTELPQGFSDPAHIRRRLRELEEKTYTMNDYVGKSGIEGKFERELRGFSGKKGFYSDARGNFLRELPGSRDPLSGHRLSLTISAELQEFAEKLLVQNEQIREIRATQIDKARRTILQIKHPWIKGGAILVMEPHTGEVLALASHPRFNPNDFIRSGNAEQNKKKKSNIRRWFESEGYISEIWDQKRGIERERYDVKKRQYYEESILVRWPNFLEFILSKDSAIAETFANNALTVAQGVALEKAITKLMMLSGIENAYAVMDELYKGDLHQPYQQKLTTEQKEKITEGFEVNPTEVKQCKKILDKWLTNIPSNKDKVLFLDICRVAVNGELFNDKLLASVGQQNVIDFRDTSAAISQVNEQVKETTKDLFHNHHFAAWRKENEKQFLKEKREIEKEQHRYAKPYIDYLDENENQMFREFWLANRWKFCELFLCGIVSGLSSDELEPYRKYFSNWHKEILQGAHRNENWFPAYGHLQLVLQKVPSDLRSAYLGSLREFRDLNRPLLGKYPHIHKDKNGQLEKHLAAAFYPIHGFGYGRSQAYRQAATQGSIFKLVTAYAAMMEKHQSLPDKQITISTLNPLEIVDSVFTKGNETYVGYASDGKPIPRSYKGGRLPRSSTRNIGKINLIKALETSSNPYFSLLAGDVLSSPKILEKTARDFSYGKRTGIALPAEIPGNVPEDLESNRTGLYAMAIGQHSLIVTPLQTGVMLSALANGGKIVTPKIVNTCTGQARQSSENPITCQPQFAYQDTLALVGIDFPLFLSVESKRNDKEIKEIPTEVRRNLPMPVLVRKILLEGMHKTVTRSQAEGIMGLSRIYHNHPEAISDYIDLKDELLGKTSTSESIERIDMESQTYIYNHIWFGGIAFDPTGSIKDKAVVVIKDKYGIPEVVVVVYLRFGSFGKEAAPVAAQIVAKWREIKSRNQQS